MHIIVGLGNPSREYEGTRHNIGFDAITRLSDDYNIALNMKKHKAICGTGYIEGEKVILAQPQTYMNLSGNAIVSCMGFFKIPKENLVIVYDDISLPFETIRIREKGSAGGHNGIKSIINRW